MAFPTHPNPPPDASPKYISPDALVRLHCDAAADVYYIDAAPGHTAPELAAALRRAHGLGLESLDPDDEQEGEAWTLDDGTTRIWLAEIAEPGEQPGS